MIEVSTDGAQIPLSRAGGWAVVVRDADSVRTETGAVRDTTANRMELRAILEGLRAVKDGAAVRLRTDSEYALKVCSEEWTARKNRDLLEVVWAETERVEVGWQKVAAHTGDRDNERADDLAESEATALHEDALSRSDGPFRVTGETKPHSETLKSYGLTWTGEGWATLNEGAFREAVEAVGAEMETDTKAVIEDPTPGSLRDLR